MEGVKDDPIGYYKTPLLNRLVTKEIEAECFTQYFVELYDGSHSDKAAYFVNKNGEDAGIYVYDFIDKESIYSPMAAILPEHRNAGLFHDMRMFHLQFCRENGIKKTHLGFRINNFNMPNKLMKNGFSIIRAEHVFHIPALLTVNSGFGNRK